MYSKEVKAEAFDLLNKGVSVSEVEKRTGIKRSTLYKLRQKGIISSDEYKHARYSASFKEEVKSRLLAGEKASALSEELSVPYGTILYWKREWGISSVSASTPLDTTDFSDRILEGATDSILAFQLHTTADRVRVARENSNIPARVQPVIVKDILALHKQGLSNSDIADNLNISYASVNTYLKQQGLEPNHYHRALNTSEDEYEEYYNKGLSDSMIAKNTYTTPHRVATWRKRTGRKPNVISCCFDSDILRLYLQGYTNSQICHELGCSDSKVYNVLFKFRLRGNRKLTNFVQESIVSEILQGLSDKEIAERYNIGEGNIVTIRRLHNLFLNSVQDWGLLLAHGFEEDNIAEWASLLGIDGSVSKSDISIADYEYYLQYDQCTEDELLRAYQAGLSDKEIASQLGVCFSKVWLWRTKNNYPKN